MGTQGPQHHLRRTRQLDNELGKRDYVTGTALEQDCDLRQGSRGATTGADGTDAAQRQNPSKLKTLSANHEDSTVKGFRKPIKISNSSTQSRWSMALLRVEKTAQMPQVQFTEKLVEVTVPSTPGKSRRLSRRHRCSSRRYTSDKETDAEHPEDPEDC